MKHNSMVVAIFCALVGACSGEPRLGTDAAVSDAGADGAVLPSDGSDVAVSDAETQGDGADATDATDAADAADAAALPMDWVTTYVPGGTDPHGALMAGTELRALVPMNGSLYAAIGYWEDTAVDDPSLPGAQVLRLDSPDGSWEVDLELEDRVATGTLAGQRMSYTLAALEVLTLHTDASGTPIAPVQVLAATTWNRGSAGLHVYVRPNATPSPTPQWAKTVLGVGTKQPPGRAFGQHVDAVTGLDRAFFGSSKAVYAATYNATTGLDWSTTPEPWFTEAGRDDTPAADQGWRLMGFVDCDGALYATVGPALYQRQDGDTPTWKRVQTVSFPVDYNFLGSGGLRAPFCLPRPGGTDHVLLIAAPGNPARILTIDPAADFATTLDQNVSELIAQAWGLSVGRYVLHAYNHFLPVVDPVTGEETLLAGFEAISPASGPLPVWQSSVGPFAATANYLVRHVDGSYDVRSMEDPALTAPPPRVAVRTLALSPFPSEQGSVLYAGGFDCNSTPSHNTAWGLKGPLAKALGH